MNSSQPLSTEDLDLPESESHASDGSFDYDLVVIGSGPAGQKGAISAAKAGARVAIVERDPLAGGVCLNTGTVPSKTLREAVLYLTGWRQRGIYGEQYRVKDHITSSDLLARTAFVIAQEREIINQGLEHNRVERLVGIGRVAGPHAVSIDIGGMETLVRTRNILLAVGTKPRRPPEVPFDDINIFDSDAIFSRDNELRPLPDSLIVLGAGVIGIEYATMFACLNIPTTLIDPRPNPLEFADEEMSALLYETVRRQGVKLVFGAPHASIEAVGDGTTTTGRAKVTLQDGTSHTADGLLFALGRVPAIDGLGLKEVGVAVDRRNYILVDESFRTSVPSIYAAGDVIGFPMLASTSADQGRVAALNALGTPATLHPDFLPFGIYTIPEMSMVGKTEQSLKKDGVPYYKGTALYRDTARGKILGDLHGALKLIFHRETNKLLGVHVVGEGASELLHIGQAVLHFDGDITFFLDNVFNYPTLAEAYKNAARNAQNRLRGVATHRTDILDQVFHDPLGTVLQENPSSQSGKTATAAHPAAPPSVPSLPVLPTPAAPKSTTT